MTPFRNLEKIQNGDSKMKTLSIILVLFLVACAGQQVQQPPDQKIIIEVQAADKTEVSVAEEAPKYELDDSPYLHLGITKINKEETKAFTYIYSGLSVVDQKRLWSDLKYLTEETNIKHIVLFINSGGGSAFAGLALAGLIDKAQSELGFIFEAEASGIIASATVPVFAVCKIRSVQKGTIFMVHEAALWKWPGLETASDIRSQQRMMEILRAQYLGFLVDHSNLSFDEWAEKEKETCWFTVEEAREWGLIDR